MNQATQANNPAGASSTISATRRRGRPRKYPKFNTEDSARIPKIQRTWPPGFGGVNGNQPRPVTSSSDAADSMVGREVSGAIEAVFDAGYLLNVRVANTDTTLRGVVFKPGHFVPVSAENDVAPYLQMIRRNKILAPTEHYNARPRDMVSKGKQVASVAVQTAGPESAIPRGNLVPVVLEPCKSSKGLPVTVEPTPLSMKASHMGASKGKQLPEELVTTANPSNGSMATTQVPTFGSEAVLVQPQTTHQLVSNVAEKNENGTETTKPLVTPLENLVSEVIKRIETPSQPTESQAVDDKLANDKPPVENDDETNNIVDQALNIEPLQAVIPSDSTNKLASSLKPTQVESTSKMSQLLEGTISDPPVPQAVAPKMSETPNLVTEHGVK